MQHEQRVDHLFLTVGGNPLPIAVAGLTLVKPDGRITLVHTGGTRDTKDRLLNWFDAKFGGDVALTPLEVDEADAHAIHTRVRDQVKRHREVLARVGLNYTGGTKAMAVHAYRAIEGEAADPIFSYLDARSLRMLFDPGDPTTPGGGGYEYLGRAPELSFERLVNLHDWQFRQGKEPTDRPLMLPVARALRDLNTIRGTDERKAALRAWLEWKDQWRDVWKNEREETLRNHTVKLPYPDSLDAVDAALREELGEAVEDDAFTIGEAARAAGFFRTRAQQTVDAKGFCHWLDGTWLESLVLDALQQTREDLHRTAMGFGLEGRSNSDTHFEFDVAALRGHQLFGFSCSSSDQWSRLKPKLFELYMRTRQFGGDLACMALVCPYDRPQNLQEQMQRDLGTDRLRVFGREHLDDLQTHLSEWIDQQTGRP